MFFNTICGAIIGAVIAVVTKDKEESIGEAILRGATTGALAGFGLDVCVATGGVGGLIISGALGAVSGMADTYWEAQNNGDEVTAGDLLGGAIIGAGGNLLFGAAGREIGRSIGNTCTEVLKATNKNMIRSVSTRSGKVLLKKVVSETGKNLLMSSTQGIFGKAFMKEYEMIIHAYD